jgi:hypothetical protein
MLKFFINKFYTVHEFDFLDYHIPPGQPGDLPVAAGHGPRAGCCWGLHQLSGYYKFTALLSIWHITVRRKSPAGSSHLFKKGGKSIFDDNIFSRAQRKCVLFVMHAL